MADFDERVLSIFRNVFSNDAIQLQDATTAGEIDGWDSLTHINLIYALEKEFGVVFKTSEASGSALRNVGELKALLKKKIAR